MNAARIRQVALVVASLDKGVARQLLSELPKNEAAAVRAAIERLDDVDAKEQDEALAAFQKRRTQDLTSSHEARDRRKSGDLHGGHRQYETLGDEPDTFGVEALFSHDSTDAEASSATMAPSPRDAALSRVLAGIEPHDVAGLLMREHPQVIAAALSKMDYDHAAAVFAALPEPLQQEVLSRISNLQVIDDEAMAALEAQLVQWTTQQLQQRRQRAASEALANRILAKTSPEQRAALTGSTPVPTTGPAPEGPPLAAPTTLRRPPLLKLRRLTAFASRQRPDVDAPEGVSPFVDLQEPTARFPSVGSEERLAGPSEEAGDDRSKELEQLDDAQLLYVLQHADEQTVRRALAVSSEGLWRRIVKKLPRSRAARLRRELFAIGPAKVSDLRRAQTDLLELAAQRAA